MGGRRDLEDWSYKGLTSSRPNSLYPDLVGNMKIKIEKKRRIL